MAAKAKNSISNVLVWIILILLIVALAGFGVSGFGGNIRSVAAVGESEVDVNNYARELQGQLSQISQARGDTMGIQEAQSLGLDRLVLQNLLTQAALNESARLAGLSVGDTTVSEQILALPNFTGPDGSFDRQSYEFALDNAGLTVSQFEESIRRDVSRSLMQGAVTAGLTAQPAFVNAIYSFVGEERGFSYAVLGESDLESPPPAPDAAAIETYYEANPAEFTTPETRSITYAILTPDMLADQVDLDEDALRVLYEERSADYNRPAMRIVDRLVFADQADAEAAKASIDAGDTSFDTLVEDRGLTLSDVELDTVTEEDLGGAGPEVFALDDLGVVGPLPTDLGPALFRVNAILTAQVTSFEDALPELREILANQQARRLIEDEIDPLDDLLAGGATLEELADESDMEIGQLDWMPGMIEGPALYGNFQVLAATVGSDDFPEIGTLEDGGIFALRLDSVNPPQLLPLEEVRDEAEAGALAEAIKTALGDQVEAYKSRLESGEDFPSLGLTATIQPGVTRNDFLENLPETLLPGLFDAEQGDILIVEGTDTLYLVRLDSVIPPDLGDPTTAAIRERLNGEIASAMAQDLLSQFARAVQAEAGISVNDAAIAAVHTQLP
ncbi:MAG: peptidylprolyl isomerase [Pseudomonadota bacterium]